MSLAEEIGKLYELHNMGALSADEFQTAKEAALRQFSSLSRPTAAPTTATNTASPADAAAAAAVASPLKQQTEAPPPPPPAPAPRTEQSRWIGPLLASIVEEEVESTQRLFPLVNVGPLLTQSFYPGHSPAATERAVGHLYRICGNILASPAVARFHQIRMGNPTLAAELFSIDGSAEFLQSVRFDLTVEGGGGGGGGGVSERWLRWRATEARGVQLLLPRLEQALAALSFLRERGEGIAKHRLDLQRLYQKSSFNPNGSGGGGAGFNIAFDIRLEQARAAMVEGRLADHVSKLFAKDDAGDGLYSAARHAGLLAGLLATAARVITSSAQPPSLPFELWLPLDSPDVFAALVQQKGSLELLLTCAGCVLRPGEAMAAEAGDDGGGGGGGGAYSAPSAPLSSQPPVCLVFPTGDDGSGTVAAAAAVAHEVTAAVRLTRQHRDNEARLAAEAAIAVERQRERRRIDHARDSEAERGSSSLSSAAAARAAQRRRAEPDSDDADDSDRGMNEPRPRGGGGGNNGNDTAGGGSKRVQLADAIAILMGKKREDGDDW